MNKTIRLGVIGCGQWGMNYIRLYSQMAGVQVVACCDPDKDRLHYVQSVYSTVACTHTCDEILSRSDIDAVCVATPAVSHYTIVKDALTMNKHVLVEKPMATQVDEARMLKEQAQKTGKVLMVGHVFHYHEGIRKIKGYIQSGELGRIYYLHSTRVNLGPVRRDVNCLWDLASHDVSVFLYLLDSVPEVVTGIGGNYLQPNLEDVCFLHLSFPRSVLGSIRVSWLDPRKTREITVVGSHKMLTFDDMNLFEPIRLYNKGVEGARFYDSFGEFQLILREGEILSPAVPRNEPLKVQCEHFVECICSGKEPLTNSDLGLKVVQVLSALEQSVKSGGTPIQVFKQT